MKFGVKSDVPSPHWVANIIYLYLDLYSLLQAIEKVCNITESRLFAVSELSISIAQRDGPAI